MSLELDTVSYTLLASIFGATALLSLRNAKGADIHPLLLNTQSDVSRLRHAGESAIYRSRMYPNGSPLLTTFDRNIRTLLDLYEQGGQIKHGEAAQQVKQVYGGLRDLTALTPRSANASSFLGIYAYQSPACHNNGLVTVPIGAKSSSSHLDHVIKTTGLQVLAVDKAHFDQVVSLIQGTSIRYLILLDQDEVTDAMKQKTTVDILSYKQIQNKGKSVTVDSVQPEPSDIASIYFSSSLFYIHYYFILFNNNFIASYLLIIPPNEKIQDKDRLLYNLPIDSVYGFVLSSIFSFVGGSIGYNSEFSASEHLTSYLEIVASAKPTVFASGPGIFELVREHIEQHYGSSFLFRRGYDKKLHYFTEGRLVTDSKYDMLVFRDIQRKLFGGQLRLIYIENDENEKPVAPFLRAVLGVQVLKVFNSAETSSTMTASMFYDYNADPQAVGAPLPCNELKLMDYPDKSLYCDDSPNPRGEIWIRGNNVFHGYWNDPIATEDVLDADGWYMTGVLGELLPNGTLKLLGPK
ncbi:hypothetical protein BJ944DRAFT_257498 [Cunninghamella echinulata]|nr:hypothetical protein BJ944DRAFT_257498 [Cunninghamella echinulata]